MVHERSGRYGIENCGCWLLNSTFVDVAQDVVVNEEDCGTLRGLEVSALKDNEDIVEPLSERILGRVSVHDVYDPITEELIIPAGD